MKFRVFLIIATLILLPTLIEADEIYGEIWVKSTGKAARDATVIACNEEAKTDINGVYSIKKVSSIDNKCKISVDYDGKKSIELNIYISDKRTRADFELKDQGDQWWLIRR